MSVLVFYSKSANKKAGYGVSETLFDIDDFTELNKIHDWRKMLSNMYISPFILGGKRYNSVEHFFHASKFMKEYPDFADTFTIESKSKYSMDPFKAKNAGKAGKVNKSGKLYKNKEFTLPNVKMRQDFYTSIANKAQVLAWYSKFTQNDKLKKLLLNTGNAKLYHLETRRGEKSTLIHFKGLEKIRECIKKYPIIIFTKKHINAILHKTPII